MFRGKKYLEAVKKFDLEKSYLLEDAIKNVLDAKYAKFDETVDIAFKLGVDPRKADQMIRGTVSLPNGTGNTKRILVFAEGEQAKAAKEAGADYVGAADLIEKIQAGWFEFDVVVAVPSMMPKIGRLGRVLGPKGLMPNPKDGTVTNDVAKVVEEIQKGKVSYRVDKSGNLHSIIGKTSFELPKLVENANAIIAAILKAKPSSAKGTYIQNLAVSSTMGPGFKVDTKNI